MRNHLFSKSARFSQKLKQYCTVSQIYRHKDDGSGINPPMKILNEIRKEVQYVKSRILSAKSTTRSMECKNSIADGKVDPIN